MIQHLYNISIKTLRDYLEWKGLKKIRTSGGHEIWSRKDLIRPIVLQTHISPVPDLL